MFQVLLTFVKSRSDEGLRSKQELKKLFMVVNLHYELNW